MRQSTVLLGSPAFCASGLRNEVRVLRGALGGLRGGGGHGERSRSQLLFKLAGALIADLDFWLGSFGWTNVAVPV